MRTWVQHSMSTDSSKVLQFPPAYLFMGSQAVFCCTIIIACLCGGMDAVGSILGAVICAPPPCLCAGAPGLCCTVIQACLQGCRGAVGCWTTFCHWRLPFPTPLASKILLPASSWGHRLCHRLSPSVLSSWPACAVAWMLRVSSWGQSPELPLPALVGPQAVPLSRPVSRAVGAPWPSSWAQSSELPLPPCVAGAPGYILLHRHPGLS